MESSTAATPIPPAAPRPAPAPALTNIETVIGLERESLRERTVVQRLTDAVTAAASSTAFIIGHLVWFAVWISANVFTGHAFDPYPFNFLTLVVSLEAIVLTGFVLMSQDRMTQLAEKRTHLDLQVNLLAEQELTAILRVVCMIAEKSGLEVRGCDPHLDQLLGKTDVTALAGELTRQLAEDGTAPGTDSQVAPAQPGSSPSVGVTLGRS